MKGTRKTVGAATLVAGPQILGMLAFATPWAFVTELPPDADGNAKVAQGGGALIIGFILAFITLPIAWNVLGSIVGGTDRRREAAATSFSFSVACFFIPLVFSPLLGLQPPVRGYFVVWLATNLLAIIAIRNHELFARTAEARRAGAGVEIDGVEERLRQ